MKDSHFSVRTLGPFLGALMIVTFLATELAARGPQAQVEDNGRRAMELLDRAKSLDDKAERIQLLWESLRLEKTVQTELALGQDLMDNQPLEAFEQFEEALKASDSADGKLRAHILYEMAIASEHLAQRGTAVQLLREAIRSEDHPFLQEELHRLELEQTENVVGAL